MHQELKRIHDEERESEEKNAVKCIKKNPKYFYQFVNSHCAKREAIATLKTESGEDIESDKDKADALANQYSSVFSKPANEIPFLDQNNNAEINEFQVTEEHLEAAVNQMNPNTSSGPDNFPSILLKHTISTTMKPLLTILRQIIASGHIPKILKSSIICPVYKPGKDRSKPSSYRPICLTSVIMRTFEKIIKSQLVQFFEENQLFNDSQHGFRQSRSCLSQLLNFYDEILRQMEDGSQVDVLYVDYEKCFDKIDHKILLAKLQSLGVRGRAFKFIKGFLTDRTFRVRVGEDLSDELIVISGIPQGTCLGPILMLIMNFDIDFHIKNGKVGSFADDSKVLNKLKSENDTCKMQQDIESLEKWTTVNNMKMNNDKFVLISYNKNSQIDNTYKLGDGTIISEKCQTKDLGVIMSNDGTFTNHINNLVSNCKRTISMIFRTFKTRNDQVMLTLYRALVLSKIDYCSVLWCPSELSDLRKLEKVQSNFTLRMKCSKTDSGNKRDYWQRLNYLNLYSIQRRFERYAVIYVWKILHEIVHNPGLEFKKEGQTQSRHGITCIVPKCTSKLREHSFLVRGPKLFNSLPKEVREFEFDKTVQQKQAVDNFKKILDDYLALIPDEPSSRSDYSKYMTGITMYGDVTNSIVRKCVNY